MTYQQTMTSHDIIEDFNDIISSYDPSKNRTNNILSKYERVKIIGIRAEQLQRGAPPFVEIDKNASFNAREVAKKELQMGKIPFMIARKLPDGKTEYWRLDDMLIL